MPMCAKNTVCKENQITVGSLAEVELNSWVASPKQQMWVYYVKITQRTAQESGDAYIRSVTMLVLYAEDIQCLILSRLHTMPISNFLSKASYIVTSEYYVTYLMQCL